jgi:hypothetical protein
MFIDGKGKLFGKVSVIDVLIVLVVLAVVGGVGYKMTRSNTITPFTSAPQDDIQIMFYVEDAPEFAAKAIQKGDLCKDQERNVAFGYVTDIQIDKSISWGQNDKGEFVASTKAGYSRVMVTAEGKGIFRDSKNYVGVTYGGADFFVGRTTNLMAGKSMFQCRIYDVKKKG